MLRSAAPLPGMNVEAADGRLGAVEDAYFDDEHWTLRYLVVEMGSRLSSHCVLLPVSLVRAVDWSGRSLSAALTREAVKSGPAVNTRRPVSRILELRYMEHYNQPPYWVLGIDGTSATEALDSVMRAAAAKVENAGEPPPTHLRSSLEVTGYRAEAADGPIGDIRDYLLDDASWRIRYLVIATGEWWSGHELVLSPEWVDQISWGTRTLRLAVAREQIRTSPPFESAVRVTPEYEAALARHYGRQSS